MTVRVHISEGGQGSGNFEHQGILGHQGGSQPTGKKVKGLTARQWNRLPLDTTLEDWPRTPGGGYLDSPPQFYTTADIADSARSGQYRTKENKYVNEVTTPFNTGAPFHAYTFEELKQLPPETIVRAIQPNAKYGQGYKMTVGHLILREEDNPISKERSDALWKRYRELVAIKHKLEGGA